MSPSISVTHRDGSTKLFNADKINRSIARACEGLSDPVGMTTQIATETQLTLYNGITTEELDQATIGAALQNVKDDPEYDTVAKRLLLKIAYKKAMGDYEDHSLENIQDLHTKNFENFINKAVDGKILDPRMSEVFDLKKLASVLDVSRDSLLDHTGLSTLLHRYALKDRHDTAMSTPQFVFMRVAMGLALLEDNPNEWAMKFYNRISTLRYIPGGSTMIQSGTLKPALSNCFLIDMQDDMEHISKSVSDVMLISKATGGIGLCVTKLRATGSPLTRGGLSTGPTPFAKIIDTAIRAIQRGGKKKGALCFYMENWHYDFPDFIDWRHNAGDDYLKMRTANTAAYLSDEFMMRVQNDQEWYMFDPKETADLAELYGADFSKRYKEYIQMAESGKIRMFKKEKARSQYKKILVSLQGTSHPWITFKDAINVRALNNNTGTIHMSNLCTEICLPQDRENTAVCNLATVNIASHIAGQSIDWSELEKTVRMAVRHLDNLIDINVLPTPEAVKSDKENRAVGLGIMGIGDAIEKLKYHYASEQSYDLVDQVAEFVSYMAIDESCNLAKSRGSYKNYKGSEWSKGFVPIDTLARLKKLRGVENYSVEEESRHKGLDWDKLRSRVKQGIRNATLMAVAPNANIGLVAGTTPGFDVRFAQVFSRSKYSGKYIDINKNLVNELKDLNIWEKVREQIIEHQGDIADIADIPQEVRDRYKTSFSTDPRAVIEIASRAQKWIDQAISRNMYLETRDTVEIMDIYIDAWKKGLKSTYYLHMKPRHTAEQSTVSVNKRAVMGRRGFGSLKKAVAKPAAAAVVSAAVSAKTVTASAPKVCPTDPALLDQCDSCQ